MGIISLTLHNYRLVLLVRVTGREGATRGLRGGDPPRPRRGGEAPLFSILAS
jgi:hypothetical protein